MKVWYNGRFEDVIVGQKVLVARTGSCKTYFGEFATLERKTANHLVFVTESGAVVKTKISNLHEVVGKAGKEGYFVSLKVEGRESDKNFISEDVRFWNSKKKCFENK